MYSQAMLNTEYTLDLWIDRQMTRVWVTERKFTENPEPPEPGKGRIYCGEITRHSIKTGEVELMVLEALDKREKPWRYAELHMFFVSPERKTVTEIPRYIPVTNDAAWNPISTQLDERLKVYDAATTALIEFNKRPLKTELMVKAGGVTILVRGHGYYGDIG